MLLISDATASLINQGERVLTLLTPFKDRVALNQRNVGKLHGARCLSEIEGDRLVISVLSTVHVWEIVCQSEVTLEANLSRTKADRHQRHGRGSVNPLIQGTPRRETGRIGSVLVDGYCGTPAHARLLLTRRIDISDDRSINRSRQS